MAKLKSKSDNVRLQSKKKKDPDFRKRKKTFRALQFAHPLLDDIYQDIQSSIICSGSASPYSMIENENSIILEYYQEFRIIKDKLSQDLSLSFYQDQSWVTVDFSTNEWSKNPQFSAFFVPQHMTQKKEIKDQIFLLHPEIKKWINDFIVQKSNASKDKINQQKEVLKQQQSPEKKRIEQEISKIVLASDTDVLSTSGPVFTRIFDEMMSRAKAENREDVCQFLSDRQKLFKQRRHPEMILSFWPIRGTMENLYVPLNKSEIEGKYAQVITDGIAPLDKNFSTGIHRFSQYHRYYEKLLDPLKKASEEDIQTAKKRWEAFSDSMANYYPNASINLDWEKEYMKFSYLTEKIQKNHHFRFKINKKMATKIWWKEFVDREVFSSILASFNNVDPSRSLSLLDYVILQQTVGKETLLKIKGLDSSRYFLWRVPLKEWALFIEDPIKHSPQIKNIVSALNKMSPSTQKQFFAKYVRPVFDFSRVREGVFDLLTGLFSHKDQVNHLEPIDEIMWLAPSPNIKQNAKRNILSVEKTEWMSKQVLFSIANAKECLAPLGIKVTPQTEMLWSMTFTKIAERVYDERRECLEQDMEINLNLSTIKALEKQKSKFYLLNSDFLVGHHVLMEEMITKRKSLLGARKYTGHGMVSDWAHILQESIQEKQIEEWCKKEKEAVIDAIKQDIDTSEEIPEVSIHLVKSRFHNYLSDKWQEKTAQWMKKMINMSLNKEIKEKNSIQNSNMRRKI